MRKHEKGKRKPSPTKLATKRSDLCLYSSLTDERYEPAMLLSVRRGRRVLGPSSFPRSTKSNSVTLIAVLIRGRVPVCGSEVEIGVSS